MKQRIKVEGKNIGELFDLPCVTMIIKGWKNNNVILRLDGTFPLKNFAREGEGDWLVEEDDGTWHVEKGDKDMKEE